MFFVNVENFLTEIVATEDRIVCASALLLLLLFGSILVI